MGSCYSNRHGTTVYLGGRAWCRPWYLRPRRRKGCSAMSTAAAISKTGKSPWSCWEGWKSCCMVGRACRASSWPPVLFVRHDATESRRFRRSPPGNSLVGTGWFRVAFFRGFKGLAALQKRFFVRKSMEIIELDRRVGGYHKKKSTTSAIGNFFRVSPAIFPNLHPARKKSRATHALCSKK